MERFKLKYTRSRRQKFIMSIAAILVFITTYALILPAITIDIDTAEEEPGMGIESTDINLPALSLEKSVENITVSVDAKDGVFPEGTSMTVSQTQSEATQILIESAIKCGIERYQTVDIAFEDEEGAAVKPQGKYNVKINSDFVNDFKDYMLAYVDGEEVKFIDDAEFTYNQVEFRTDTGAAFTMFKKGSYESMQLTADGDLYEATVLYDYSAHLPEGTRLEITEFANGSSKYNKSLQEFEAVSAEKDDEKDLGEELFTDIIDLTLYDKDGKEVEPAAAVNVSVKRKNLPEDFVGKDGGLIVKHLDKSGDEPVVETMDSAVVLAADSVTASFAAESFSQYRLRWYNSGYHNVTVEYGYVDSNGQYHQFETGTPAHTPDFSGKNNYNYSNNGTHFTYLIQDIPGYKYKETRYTGGNYTNRQITPLLAYNTDNNVWRYTNNFDKLTNMPYNSDGWVNLNDNSTIRVIYEIDDSEPTDGGEPLIYEYDTGDPDPPEMHKTSTNNHDGTRTITLSIDGHANPILVEKLADVIVVFDISGSMAWDMDGNTPADPSDSRLEQGKRAISNLADRLLSSEYYNREDRPQIRMSLVTFSNTAQYRPLSASDEPILKDENDPTSYWQPYPDLNFTTDATRYKSLLTNLTADGGTNWEMALKLANEMPVDPERATYVIFVTDGNPTFRVTRDPTVPVTDANIEDDCDENYYRHYSVFGHGSADPHGYNYDAALNQANSIVGHNKNLYCIGISDLAHVGLVERLTDDSNAGAGHSVIVDNESALEAAFSDIRADITGHVGWSDVHVTDGITSMTNLVAKTHVTGASSELVYRKVFKDSNGNEVGTPINNWDPTAEGCNEAVYNPETGAIEWDMGADFQLEDNVTYEVSFRVWPNQHAIDIVTQLNNNEIEFEDLTEEEKAQIDTQSAGGYTVYTLKTNTSAGMTYTPTRYTKSTGMVETGPPRTNPCLDEVEPLVMQTMDLQVSKLFSDSFGDETGDGIGADRPTEVVLYLETRPVGGGDNDWEPVNLFEQPDGTYSNKIVLNNDVGWKSKVFYVAPGLVDKDGNTREVGHEFRVLEPVLDYHYELAGEVINPLMQGYGDDNNPNLNYDQPLRVVKEVYVVKQYNGDVDDSLDLSAVNEVKGGININKLVVNASGTPIDCDETFTFKGWILDPDGNPFIFDPANDDRVDKSLKTDPNAPLFAAHQNDPIPYHFYAQNGDRTIYKGHFADTSDITFTLKAGEQLRFPIIPIGSTYQFYEVDGNGMPTGYFLESAEGIVQENLKDPVTGTYSFVNSTDPDKPYPTTDSQNRINGTVYGNSLSRLEFKNRAVDPGKIVVKKTVVKSDLQTEIFPDDVTFTFTGYIRERYYQSWRWRYRGYSLDYVIYNKDGSVANSGHINDTYNNLSFTLKAGQYIEFLDVPAGAQYQFSENTSAMSSDYSFADASASAVSAAGGSVTQPDVSNAGVVSGTMQANQEHDAYFTNRTTRNPVPLQIIKVYAKDQTERINEVSFMLYSDAAHNTPAEDYEGDPIGLITTGGYADEEETIPLGYARIGDLWPGTYYLVETVTPAGYRPPSDHMVITIGNDGSVTLTDPDNASATGTGNVTEVNGIVTVAIPNTKYSDAVLPRTGGMGSTLFYISGGLLITAAAAIYIFCFRRRKGGKTEPDFLM